MNIALIAHDNKKELMIQFCIAYSGILTKHSLFSTETTGRMVSEETGLKVTRFMGGPQGGVEQISAKIACGEIDMLIYFRDCRSGTPVPRPEAEILRLCDFHTVPSATNLASAELLILGLQSGLLDWRMNGGAPDI